MNKFFSCALLLLAFVTFSASRPPSFQEPKSKIRWLTIQEAYELNQKSPKKMIVDVYTDWCGWCKVMDKQTFTNPAVAEFISRNYYAVKLNAEQREPIVLGKEKFVYVDQGGRGYHQLAAVLMKNKLSYPTVVFLDEKMGLIQPVAGYMEAPIFHQVIAFFAGNHHTQETFDQFSAKTYREKYSTKL